MLPFEMPSLEGCSFIKKAAFGQFVIQDKEKPFPGSSLPFYENLEPAQFVLATSCFTVATCPLTSLQNEKGVLQKSQGRGESWKLPCLLLSPGKVRWEQTRGSIPRSELGGRHWESCQKLRDDL
jgi:hypothetical protein